LTPHHQLALLLRYVTTRLAYKDLSLEFGIVETTVGCVVRNLTRIVLNILEHNDDSRIAWPNAATIRRYQEMFARRHPGLQAGVFGVLDGLQLTCNNHTNRLIQNAFYNGWKCDTFISNILVFAPDGTIFFAVVNFPGSYHDSKVAVPVYEMLEHHTPDNCFLLGDIAFQNQPKILTTLKSNQRSDDAEERKLQNIRHQEVTSARQIVEWGNGQLQKTFTRLQEELRGSDSEYNERLILICIYLLNFRTRRMKVFNQIQSVFSVVEC
jgi:hypothetical protein